MEHLQKIIEEIKDQLVKQKWVTRIRRNAARKLKETGQRLLTARTREPGSLKLKGLHKPQFM